MVDQELSLFHDTPPQLSITDLRCSLPGPESLWLASDSQTWIANTQSLYGSSLPYLISDPAISPSLHDLFQEFLQDSLFSHRGSRSLTPQHLRLLLHPLQAMLCHIRQMLSCFGDSLPTRHRRSSSRGVTKSGTMQRLEEVQALLQRWYELSVSLSKATNQGECNVTHCNLILYHLISLNAVTDFPEIESIARQEGFDPSCSGRPGVISGNISTWDLSLRYKRAVYAREEALFHSGQSLRLLQAMEKGRRPSWWSAALYRATMVCWVEGLARSTTVSLNELPLDSVHFSSNATNQTSHTVSAGSPVAVHDESRSNISTGTSLDVPIDRTTPEDPTVYAFLCRGEGTPVLSWPAQPNCTVPLDRPGEVLKYACEILSKETSTRLGDGIRRKLIRLSEMWGEQIAVASIQHHHTPAASLSSSPPPREIDLAGTNTAMVGMSVSGGAKSPGVNSGAVSPGLSITHINPSAVGLGVSTPGVSVGAM